MRRLAAVGLLLSLASFSLAVGCKKLPPANPLNPEELPEEPLPDPVPEPPEPGPGPGPFPGPG